MTVNAGGLSGIYSRITHPAHKIFSTGDDFEVIWVAAGPVPTEVVYLKTFRDVPGVDHIGDAMGKVGFVVVTQLPIAVLHQASSPVPASRGKVNHTSTNECFG